MIKIGRNEPCPCGSGKKFKKCCINGTETAHPVETAHPTETVYPFERLLAIAREAEFLPTNADSRKACFVPRLMASEISKAVSFLVSLTIEEIGASNYEALLSDVPFGRLMRKDVRHSFDENILGHMWVCASHPFVQFKGKTAAVHFASQSQFSSGALALSAADRRVFELIKIFSTGHFEVGKIVPCEESGNVITLGDAFSLWKTERIITQNVSCIFNSPALKNPDFNSIILAQFVSTFAPSPVSEKPHQAPTCVVDFIKSSNRRELFSSRESLCFVCEWEGIHFAFGLQNCATLPLGFGEFLKQWDKALPRSALAPQPHFAFHLHAMLHSRAWGLLVGSEMRNQLNDVFASVEGYLAENFLNSTAKARAEVIASILADEAETSDFLFSLLQHLDNPENENLHAAFIDLWTEIKRIWGGTWIPDAAVVFRAVAPNAYAIQKKQEQKQKKAKLAAAGYRKHWRVRRDDISPASFSDVQILKLCESLRQSARSQIQQRGLGVSVPHITFSRQTEEGQGVVYYKSSQTLVFPASHLTHTSDSLLSVVMWAVAHVLADEYLKTTGRSEKAYELAWNRLGLDAQFRSTNNNMFNMPQHWKEKGDKTPEEEKFLGRIDKLFALAESSNEAEATLAMERAQEMLSARNMTRHREGKNGHGDMVNLVLHLDSARLENTTIAIGTLLANFYFVKIIYAHQLDPIKNQNLRVIHVLGRRENVLMAEHVFDFLTHKINALWLAAKKEKNLPGKARLSYQMGLVSGFSKKLKAMVDARNAASALAGIKMDEGALVALEGHDLSAYAKEKFPSLGKLSVSDFKVHKEGYSLGTEDGADIVIHAPLGSAPHKQDVVAMLT